jgi:propanol-preferring alcohol dehydrogenase
MVLKSVCDLSATRRPLEPAELPEPVAGAGEILVKVSVCGVCHTELDEIEGRTPPTKFPAVLGHEVVGRVVKCGSGAKRFSPGDRVGIAWIHSACGKCHYCATDRENLCDDFEATGRDVAGGYAEYTVVPEKYAYRIPDVFSDAEAAPLLCAGAVGYRSLKLAEMTNGRNLGLTGFGASAHLVIQTALHMYPDSKVFVFARSVSQRRFAMELGAFWSGDTLDEPPEKLHSIIDTTPVWMPVVEALKHLEKGGRLVINAIRKEEADKDVLLKMDYAHHLWLEKEIKSVANVTGGDVEAFLNIAADIPIRPEVQLFPLEDANKALLELRERKIKGAKVLRIG